LKFNVLKKNLKKTTIIITIIDLEIDFIAKSKMFIIKKKFKSVLKKEFISVLTNSLLFYQDFKNSNLKLIWKNSNVLKEHLFKGVLVLFYHRTLKIILQKLYTLLFYSFSFFIFILKNFFYFFFLRFSFKSCFCSKWFKFDEFFINFFKSLQFFFFFCKFYFFFFFN
jgi:hypothetical protein